ncbi:MAG: hypothetical protein H8D53_02410 [Bacteroidetes bacterium]|nr:hypothetical protein [Bacteroidota bacterium]
MMEDRNISKMDVEFYLLNREYNKLNSDELAIVNEHVESEQEFNEMKAVVMGVGNIFKEEKELAPNPAIKVALLKEFDKQQPARAYWLNGIFVSLFPKEKKLFQKPGMQLIGLAASVLLIVTIAFNGNTDINNSTLAQNESVKTEEEAVEEVSKLEREEVAEEKNLLEKDLEPTKEVLEKDLEVATLNEVEIEEKSETVENKGITKDFMYDAQPIESVEADLSIAADLDYRRNDNNLNASEESFKKGVLKDKEKVAISDDKLVISATTPATTEVVEEFSMSDDEGYFSDDVSAGAIVTGNNSIDLPVNSRSLAEDSDLIGILYTAM